MLDRFQLSATNRPVDCVMYWRNDPEGLLLNPPYQRGDVWGTKRRQNLIKSILLGIPIPSLIINSRMDGGWKDDYRIAVIDGKQRITTILMFMDSQLSVPGDWFGMDADLVTYQHLGVVNQRCFRSKPIPFSEGALKTIEQEQLVFDLVNFGGLAQGESDVE